MWGSVEIRVMLEFLFYVCGLSGMMEKSNLEYVCMHVSGMLLASVINKS